MVARLKIVGLLMAFALVLAACGGDDGDGGEDTAGTTGGGTTGGETAATGGTGGECSTPDPIVSGHPGFPPDFIQMVTPLAIELGYMEQECIDLELIDFESGAAAFRSMAAGELDVGLSGSVSPILAFGQGSDAVGFAGNGAYVDFQVVATSDVQSCEDLAGKRVATDGPGGLVHAITEQYLATCGIDINTDVELIVG